MNVMQPRAYGPVRERGGMTLQRPPMFRVGPFLMRIKLVQIRTHRFSGSRCPTL
jgi:hypothetical protein